MKGLCWCSNIIDGKFSLVEGKTKARYDIYFACMFDVQRPYESYFGTKVLSLLHSIEQKSVSAIIGMASIIKHQIEESILESVSGIKINGIDIGYVDTDRKHYGVAIDYSYSGTELRESFTDVIFI